jgi:hypothetical protein
MSEVISFRLSNENPREIRALEVLNRLRVEGQSIRLIITEALLKLDDQQTPKPEQTYWVEVSDKLNCISEMIEKLGIERPQEFIPENKDLPDPTLSDSFVASIIKSVIPGIELE